MAEKLSCKLDLLIASNQHQNKLRSSSPGRAQGACFCCGEKSHMARECEIPETSQNRKHVTMASHPLNAKRSNEQA